MEKKQETRKTKSLTQKAKKIRSVVMMTLLCVLLMSAATYAWFTLSNTAKATNLTMTVGDTTGLQIAPDNGTGAGTFGSSITFNDIKGTILPATTSNGINFLKPIYDDDGSVSSTEAATEYLDVKNDDTNKEGYYIQYTFYLKSLGADSDVWLKAGSGISDGTWTADGSQYNGTYMLAKEVDNDKKVPASAAIRMSLTVDGASTVSSIFEPNNNIENPAGLEKGMDYAENKLTLTVASPTIIQDKSGKMTTNGVAVHLLKDKATKIVLNIWIEGTDAQCVNQISAKNLIGQLVFTKEETAQP